MSGLDSKGKRPLVPRANVPLQTQKSTSCGIVHFQIKQPVSVQHQRELFKLIEKQKVNMCAPNALTFKKWLQASGPISASPTLQFFVDYANRPLMLKAGFQETNFMTNQISAEREIYRNVTNPLIFNRNTPHLIVHYADFVCDTNSLVRKASGVAAAVEKIRAEGYQVDQFYGMLVERAQGTTLQDLLLGGTLTTIDLAIILFQIMWTLTCFKEVGMVHNDLHTKNVFVNVSKQKETRIYVENSLTFQITSQFTAKIFDFDRSAKVSTKISPCSVNNSLIKKGKGNHCEQFGECNVMNERVDCTILLYFILADLESSVHRKNANTLRNFIEQTGIVDLNWLATLQPPMYAWYGKFCRKKADGTCVFDHVTSKQIKSPMECTKILGAPWSNFTSGVGDACHFDSVYVLPSLMTQYGLSSCTSGVNSSSVGGGGGVGGQRPLAMSWSREKSQGQKRMSQSIPSLGKLGKKHVGSVRSSRVPKSMSL